jgi:hypothetical protein
MSEDQLSVIMVLDAETMVDVTVVEGEMVNIIVETTASDTAEIVIMHDVPGAIDLEGLRGLPGNSGLQADAPVDLAGWYSLQKEL